MANQEQVSKQNTYAIIGALTSRQAVAKMAVYAIVNNTPPPPPPPVYILRQIDIFTGSSNSNPPVF